MINIKTLILTILTSIYLVTSGYVLLKKYFENESSTEYYEEEKEGRNESSTPRLFVLPATPAVTYEQESRKNESLK